MSTLLAIAALIFLDGVWRWVVFGALILLDVVEIAIRMRWRKRRSLSGEEGIVGETGFAITDLRPQGQIRVRGQVWTGVAAEPIAAGEAVEVLSNDGLKLNVTRRAGDAAPVNLSE